MFPDAWAVEEVARAAALPPSLGQSAEPLEPAKDSGHSDSTAGDENKEAKSYTDLWLYIKLELFDIFVDAISCSFMLFQYFSKQHIRFEFSSSQHVRGKVLKIVHA